MSFFHNEGISTSSASITSSDITIAGDTTTFSSANSTDPLVVIKNTTNDANGARLRFVKDKGAAGADNDACGIIEFYGDDDNQDNIAFAKIEAIVNDASNGDECGSLKFYVAENDGNNTVGLLIAGSTTDGEVDVTIAAGSASTTTVSGNLTVTTLASLTASEINLSATGKGLVINDSGVLKSMSGAQLATEIGAVTTGDANIFTAQQKIDIGAEYYSGDSTDGSHFHIEGGVTMTDNQTSNSATATADYNQVTIERVTLAADNTSVTTTNASTLYIDNAPAAGTNQTLTNAYALNVAAGGVKFGGTVTMSGFIINTYDEITFGSGGGQITATSSDGTAHDPISSIVYLKAAASSTDTTYHWDLTSFTGANGQSMMLMWSDAADTGITALQVNFGSNVLVTGNGTNDSLTFNTIGQSAHLIFIDSKWRICNTGASVS